MSSIATAGESSGKKKFINSHPRRYGSMPQFLVGLGNDIIAAADEMGQFSVNPRLRQASVAVDFTGKQPVIRVSDRFKRKWSKAAQIPVVWLG
jgi:hypothetical protein